MGEKKKKKKKKKKNIHCVFWRITRKATRTTLTSSSSRCCCFRLFVSFYGGSSSCCVYEAKVWGKLKIFSNEITNKQTNTFDDEEMSKKYFKHSEEIIFNTGSNFIYI